MRQDASSQTLGNLYTCPSFPQLVHLSNMDSGPNLQGFRRNTAANIRQRQEKAEARGANASATRRLAAISAGASAVKDASGSSAVPSDPPAPASSARRRGALASAAIAGMSSPSAGDMATPALPMSQLRVLFGARNKSSPREMGEQVWVCSHCETRNPPSKSVLKRCTNCNKKSAQTFTSSTPKGWAAAHASGGTSTSRRMSSGRTGYRALGAASGLSGSHSALPLVSSPSQMGMTPGPRQKPAVPLFGNAISSSSSSRAFSNASSSPAVFSASRRASGAPSSKMQGLRSSLKPAQQRRMSRPGSTSQPRVKFATMSRSRKATQISSFAQITSPHAVPQGVSRRPGTSTDRGSFRAGSQLGNVGASPVWKRLWPQLQKMGWSVHESRRKITYLRPNAKLTTAKRGVDKYENQTDLLNSLTDEEFANASNLADARAGRRECEC